MTGDGRRPSTTFGRSVCFAIAGGSECFAIASAEAAGSWRSCELGDDFRRWMTTFGDGDDTERRKERDDRERVSRGERRRKREKKERECFGEVFI